MKRAAIAVGFLLLGWSEAQGGMKYYRYVDSDGNVVISDQAPVRMPQVDLPAIDKKALRPHIQRAASINKVAPLLIEAVITHESGWRPKAVSHKGAMGLMQLMPGTARAWGVTDPFDPVQNIMGGTRYLKYLMGLFNNDLSLAIAAYHSGEERVMRTKAIPPILATRKYVLDVLKTYAALSSSSL